MILALLPGTCIAIIPPSDLLRWPAACPLSIPVSSLVAGSQWGKPLVILLSHTAWIWILPLFFCIHSIVLCFLSNLHAHKHKHKAAFFTLVCFNFLCHYSYSWHFLFVSLCGFIPSSTCLRNTQRDAHSHALILWHTVQSESEWNRGQKMSLPLGSKLAGSELRASEDGLWLRAGRGEAPTIRSAHHSLSLWGNFAAHGMWRRIV